MKQKALQFRTTNEEHSNLFVRFRRQVIQTAKQNGIADFPAMPFQQYTQLKIS